jgi:hypothetical protein
MFPRTLIAPALALVLLAGCSTSGSDEPEAAETTTTAAAETTTTAEGTTTSGSSPAGGDPWTADAQAHRGEDGEQFDQDCPAGGEADTIWGVELYTDDSSICTAAVHVGLLSFDEGGTVTYEIAPGEDRYESGIANEITSMSYGSWDGSFLFPDAPPGTGEFQPGVDSWAVTPLGRALAEGDSYEHQCGPGGTPGRIWGTQTYTADSSICTAAVHAGLISAADGGTVAIEVIAGQETYEGTEANGVLSSAYGSFGLSFTFADEQPEA